jgi:hypothetical protein
MGTIVFSEYAGFLYEVWASVVFLVVWAFWHPAHHLWAPARTNPLSFCKIFAKYFFEWGFVL